MRQQSSSRGSASVTALPVRSQPSTIGVASTLTTDLSPSETSMPIATSQTENSPIAGKGYGAGKWDPNIKASNPHEDWLLMQAISFTGRREITVAEAKILWQFYDPATRQPAATSEGEKA